MCVVEIGAVEVSVQGHPDLNQHTDDLMFSELAQCAV